MSKKENKVKGNFGENLACEFLEKNGYEILERNFNCYYGEIDIIASDKKEIVFVEVKTRCQGTYGEPIEAVDKNKRKHIYNTASYFLYKTNLLEANVRFDVVEILIFGSESYHINHLKDVITERPY